MLDDDTEWQDWHESAPQRYTEMSWLTLVCDVILDDAVVWPDLDGSHRTGEQKYRNECWCVMWCCMMSVCCEIWIEVCERGEQKFNDECWVVMWCGRMSLCDKIGMELTEQGNRSVLMNVGLWCDVGWWECVARFGWKSLNRWTEVWWWLLGCDVILDVVIEWQDLDVAEQKSGIVVSWWVFEWNSILDVESVS